MGRLGRGLFFVVLAACAVSVAGCGGGYYLVREPNGEIIYYTHEVELEDGGVIRFMDAGSGSMVTIQNSVVKEITKEEFEAGLKEGSPTTQKGDK
jgi:hypothetical protein